MQKSRVIEFDSKERILKKARRYVESVETFFVESEHAIPREPEERLAIASLIASSD